MDLATIWFVLIAVLWSGYFLLEGFDFGVGTLLPVLPRNEAERGTMFESIGPVWDGNEVWLVIAGGATFAAFPAWYATMFSGFYLALLLILVLLIVRVAMGEHGGQRRRRLRVGRGARQPCARRAAELEGRLHRQRARPLQRLHRPCGHLSRRPLCPARRGLPDRAHERRAVRARGAGGATARGTGGGRRHGLPGLDCRRRHQPQRPRRVPHRPAR